MSTSLICTVVVNYKTWSYTQACVDSLLACQHPGHIVIVDNASPNDSVDKLTQFLASVSDSVDVGQFEGFRTMTIGAQQATITLIESRVNGGYSAGNNIGLRYGLANSNCAYFWVLNNDTIVHPAALQALHSQAETSILPKPGLIGSVLMHYDRPDVVQSIGGHYLPWLGIAFPVGDGLTDQTKLGHYKKQINYVIGAACFMQRSFLMEVGLMDEDYFLYYEDTEWSYRATRLGYTNDVCLTSVVYHRDGGSTRQSTATPPLVDYYFARNKIRFSKVYFPYWLPTLCLSALAATVWRLLNRNTRAAKLILAVTVEELFGRAPNYPDDK
ncbi:glycosyltransferase family 2 protein [Spirosoma lituiforme]